MFEGDIGELATVDLLAAAADALAERDRCEARLLEFAQHFADRHSPDTLDAGPGAGDDRLGRERVVVLGGEGCPAVGEFAAAEFGAVVLGVSPGVAADFIGQALALRHRLPRTWAAVLAGEATPWKARKVATATRDLSLDAAALVDARVAGVINSVTPIRLARIVTAAVLEADPGAAHTAAERKARERGVYVSRDSEHGTTSMWILAATGDVVRFNATVDDIATALEALGDTDPLRVRRAKAIGIIANPTDTQALLTAARTPRATLLPHADPSGEPPAATDPTPATPRPGRPAAPDATVGQLAHAGRAAGSSVGVVLVPAGPAAQTDHPTSPAAEPRVIPIAADDEPSTGGTVPPVSPVVEPWDVPSGAEGEPSTGGTASSVPPVVERWDLPSGAEGEPSTDGTASPVSSACSVSAVVEPWDLPSDDADPLMDATAQRVLNAKLAALPGIDRSRTGSVLHVHLSLQTLATGEGVVRVEGAGPMLASQLTELIGHRPYTVQPVIDLNEHISVDAYEIPRRIRERVKLIYPVEQFPYGTAETTLSTDLDHIQPYKPNGPPQQTGTDTLIPLKRSAHRMKTHGRWQVRKLPDGALEWTSPHRFTFRVNHTGTHRIHPDNCAGA